MRIYVTSVFVDDQRKALDFYTNTLGFEKKTDIDLGGASWLTVVSPEHLTAPSSCSSHPAIQPSRRTRTPWSRTGSRPRHSRSTTSRRSSIGSNRMA